ncbi:MAG TPA: four helix bundle protein [Pirellulales bacterium]|jgi:four helix bundle protein|nr:four helix bundle protein [Pirellulales bacterium]
MQNAKFKTGNPTKGSVKQEGDEHNGRMLKGEDLGERLLDFAVRVGKVADALPKTRLGRHVAAQLVRCGTSPAPNYEEARAAESRADFIHKLRICLKELRETRCWLRMAAKGDLLRDSRLGPIIDEATQLCNIFGQSLVTARQRSGGKKRHAKP